MFLIRIGFTYPDFLRAKIIHMQIGEIITTVLFVSAVTAVFIVLAVKQKKSSWEGVLVKKRKHYDSENMTTSYKLVFKTSDGKKKRVQVKSEKFFNEWMEGDKGIKESGEYFPKKG